MKMHSIILATLIPLLAPACASAGGTQPQALPTATPVAVPPTNTPAAPTPTSTVAPTATMETRTPTPTPSRVPRLTPTPTPFPTYTPIPSANLDAPGIPAIPSLQVTRRYSDQINKSNARVYRYRIHQRDLEVYVAQEGWLSESQERQAAEWCVEQWTRIWEIFGGYAYPSYECVFSRRLGVDVMGISMGPSSLHTRFSPPLIAHEVFHAWNGGHLHFPETWIREGLTSYYNNLLVTPARAMTQINWQLEQYRNLLKSGGDETLFPQSSRSSREDVPYWKGALVFYMLDVEISERTSGTKSLDNPLRRLYLQVWTQAKPVTTLQRQALYDAVIAEAGSPEFFTAFFKDYVEGKRNLLEWHNGMLANPDLIYLPPHPPVK